jgi:hypothetical protein
MSSIAARSRSRRPRRAGAAATFDFTVEAGRISFTTRLLLLRADRD